MKLNKISIDVIQKDIEKLKPLPLIVQEALELMHKPEISAKDVAKLIKKDQIITARILQVANSAVFGGITNITTISQAIPRLGFDNVINIITSICCKDMFKNAGKYQLEETGLWQHSIACGLMCESIIKYKKIQSKDKSINLAEQAFIVGLLHDIGKTILIKYIDDNFEDIRTCSQAQNKEFYLLEKELVGYSHEEISKLILEKWNIPETLITPVYHHHNPKEYDKNLSNVLLNVLYVGNVLSNNTGIGLGYDKMQTIIDEDIMKKLNISNDDVYDIMDLFMEKIDMFMSDYKL